MFLACAIYLFATPIAPPMPTDGLPPYFVKILQPRTLFAQNESARLVLRIGNQSERSLKTKKLPKILESLIIEKDGKRLKLDGKYSTKKLFGKISSINMGYHRDFRLNLNRYFPDIEPGNVYQVRYQDDIYKLEAKDFNIAAVDLPPLDAHYVVQTSKGDFTLELNPDQAPEHSRNFAILVAMGFYKDMIFHRVIKDYVIQTGDPQGNGLGGSKFSLQLEKSPFLKHTQYALGMARGNAADSASSQFYICLSRVKELDGGYTIFGKAVDGFDVIQAIGAVETSNASATPPKKPLQDVKLKTIVIQPKAAP